MRYITLYLVQDEFLPLTLPRVKLGFDKILMKSSNSSKGDFRHFSARYKEVTEYSQNPLNYQFCQSAALIFHLFVPPNLQMGKVAMSIVIRVCVKHNAKLN